MDRDGTKSGYDIELTAAVSSRSIYRSSHPEVPATIPTSTTPSPSEGLMPCLRLLFHYNEIPIPELKKYLSLKGIRVRI